MYPIFPAFSSLKNRAWCTTKLTLPSFSIRRTKARGAVAHGTTHRVVRRNAAPAPGPVGSADFPYEKKVKNGILDPLKK